jgi:hypothetical protein
MKKTHKLAELIEAHWAEAQALAVAMPFNTGKGLDVGRENAISPPHGATPSIDAAAASPRTLREAKASTRT